MKTLWWFSNYNICQSVHADWNMSTTIRWIGVKFGADIRAPQRINFANFCDRLSFNFQTTRLPNYGSVVKRLNSESEGSEYSPLTVLVRPWRGSNNSETLKFSDIILIWKSARHHHNILQSHSCSAYLLCQFILLLNWGNLTSACAKNKPWKIYPDSMWHVLRCKKIKNNKKYRHETCWHWGVESIFSK